MTHEPEVVSLIVLFHNIIITMMEGEGEHKKNVMHNFEVWVTTNLGNAG